MSNEWLQNLKEGDPVIASDSFGEVVTKVVRTTKTQIIVDRGLVRFRRSDGGICGGTSWLGSCLKEANEESVKQITESQHRIKMIAKLREARWNNCKTETLEKVVALFDEDKAD